MSDTSKKALIALLGIAILVVVYMYVFRTAQEDIDSLNTQITSLQTRLDDLIAKEAQKDTLIAETEAYNKQFDAILKNYPADLNQETTVMFFKSMEETISSKGEVWVNNNFSMPAETEFYTLGGKAASSEVTDDALTGESKKAEKYICTTATYNASYTGSYEGVKGILDYLLNYRYRVSPSSLNISYNESADSYSGSLAFSAYAISGPDRTPEKTDPGLPTGTDNLFFAGDGKSGSGSRATSKYDADNGAAIVQSNNLVVLLNSANSDLSAGIIAASNSNRDETYVTSNDNNRVDMLITVFSEDGKNYIQYGIGSSSYTAEVLSEDVAIYVKSSARVDSNDANGVDVTVLNTTTLPVFFKVVDDDSTAPRFKIVNKSNNVKVYY